MKNQTRIEYHDGPDSFGNYTFTVYWLAEYHPGHPDGEYRLAERGQVFHANPVELGYETAPYFTRSG